MSYYSLATLSLSLIRFEKEGKDFSLASQRRTKKKKEKRAKSRNSQQHDLRSLHAHTHEQSKDLNKIK